jgi:sarcosine oxidase subunit gamma
MPDAILRAAALDPAARISLRPAPGMVTLRGDLAAAPIREALLAATGLPLPDRRRIVIDGDRAAAWMSPDEVLVLTAPGEGARLASGLGRALAGVHHLAADVSAARAVFRIEGPGSRDVIAKGAPVDLSPAAFGLGDFRRTRLGQVSVAFWMVDEKTIDLVCFRSVADFVARWLANAAAPGSLPDHR